METSTGKPYVDEKQKNYFVRTFDENIDPMELIWHKDKKNRIVQVLKGTGWLLQYDNKLPIILEKNKVYLIKAETYHRILKGSGNLTLKIKEE